MEKTVIGNKIKEKCDCLGISGGWTPMVHLFTQSGGKLKFRKDDNVFVPDLDKTPSNQISVGSCNGDFELEEVIRNTLASVKKFINIKDTNLDNLKITCSKETSKKYMASSFR